MHRSSHRVAVYRGRFKDFWPSRSNRSHMAKTERQIADRAAYRRANLALTDKQRIVVDLVVCKDQSLELAGYAIEKKSKRRAIIAARHTLRDAGYRRVATVMKWRNSSYRELIAAEFISFLKVRRVPWHRRIVNRPRSMLMVLGRFHLARATQVVRLTRLLMDWMPPQRRYGTLPKTLRQVRVPAMSKKHLCLIGRDKHQKFE